MLTARSQGFEPVVFDTRLQARFATGAAEHTVLLGWDWQKADWDGLRGAMLSIAGLW